MPVSVPIPYIFYHYCSVIQLEVRDGDSDRDLFIVENSFSSPVLFVIQMNLQIALLTMKN